MFLGLFFRVRALGRVRDHDRIAFCGDVFNNTLTRGETIQAAIGFRDHVHGRDHALVKLLLTVRDGLSDGGFFGIGFAVRAHRRFGVHQVIHRNVAALGNLIVVKVMRAGDLHRTRTEFRIGVFIGDDRDEAPQLFRADRNFAQLTDDRSIALIIGMNRDRAVAEHRLRACRRN